MLNTYFPQNYEVWRAYEERDTGVSSAPRDDRFRAVPVNIPELTALLSVSVRTGPLLQHTQMRKSPYLLLIAVMFFLNRQLFVGKHLFHRKIIFTLLFAALLKQQSRFPVLPKPQANLPSLKAPCSPCSRSPRGKRRPHVPRRRSIRKQGCTPTFTKLPSKSQDLPAGISSPAILSCLKNTPTENMIWMWRAQVQIHHRPLTALVAQRRVVQG